MVQVTLWFKPVDVVDEDRGPGRPRRDDRKVFTIGDLANAARILNYQAPPPPPCVCDVRDYWLYVDKRGRLIAECRWCKYKRVYSTAGRAWGPFPSSAR